MELRLRQLLATALLGVLTVAPAAFAAESAADPAGTWLVEDGRAKIKIEKCGPEHKNICGNVVWIKDPLDDKGRPKTDVNNPDPAKRSRPAIGLQLMSNLTPDDDQVFSGQIYNAENGKMYDVTVKAEKPTDLRVKGCLVSILCMSQHWTRVADLPMPGAVVANAQKKAHAAPATAAPTAQQNAD
jgi:uncharacterized protein (DUF2147 family)